MFEATKQIQIQKLWSDLDVEALCQVTSALNAGRKCSVDRKVVDMGGANYHVHIRFEDKSPPWLARVPRGAWPLALEKYLVRSEYATLKFLESTKIPSPKVFGHGIRGEQSNKVGPQLLTDRKNTG